MKKVDKIRALKAMHNGVKHIGDEELYYHWTSLGVPDCPSEDDYEFIASDRVIYEDVVNWFIELMDRKW